MACCSLVSPALTLQTKCCLGSSLAGRCILHKPWSAASCLMRQGPRGIRCNAPLACSAACLTISATDCWSVRQRPPCAVCTNLCFPGLRLTSPTGFIVHFRLPTRQRISSACSGIVVRWSRHLQWLFAHRTSQGLFTCSRTERVPARRFLRPVMLPGLWCCTLAAHVCPLGRRVFTGAVITLYPRGGMLLPAGWFQAAKILTVLSTVRCHRPLPSQGLCRPMKVSSGLTPKLRYSSWGSRASCQAGGILRLIFRRPTWDLCCSEFKSGKSNHISN